MKPAKLKILFLLVLAFILTFLVSKFFIDRKDLDKPDKSQGVLSDTILDKYLTSTKKTGKFFVTTHMPPNTYHETAFYWISDKQFRIDYYKPGIGKRMSVMSEDGQNVYFCDPKHSICYHTGLPIEQYLLAFYLPSDNLEELGEDEDQGCDQIRYVTQKTFKVVGTDPYYVEDITYCTNGEELLSFTMRDAFVEDDGSTSDYLVNHFEVEEFELDAEFEEDIFKLLYPIGKDPYAK